MSQGLPDHCHHQGPSVSTKLPCLTVLCPLGVGQVTVSVNCTQANRCILDHHLFLWTCFRCWKWHLLSLVQMVFDVSGWPKSCSRLSVHSYGKPQMNFWSNPARDPRPPREENFCQAAAPDHPWFRPATPWQLLLISSSICVSD